MLAANGARCDRCGGDLSNELPKTLGYRPMQTLCTGCAYRRVPTLTGSR